MKAQIGLAVWLVSVAVAWAAEPQPAVIGRVLDADGNPVAGVDVDFFWRANRAFRDENGKVLSFSPDEAVSKEIWSHPGEMNPAGEVNPGEIIRTGADGRFSQLIPKYRPFSLMAMDQQRTRGALFALPKDYDGTPLEVRLGPLVKFQGTFVSPDPDRKLAWSVADLQVPYDPTRPLDFRRIANCGSYDGRFVFYLPVGRYMLYANNDDKDWPLRLEPPLPITLTADHGDLDLGPIRLKKATSVRYEEREAKKTGTLGDYTKHYGKAPPPWHAIDARGVPKDVELSAFKGKWVLLDFWGLSCASCLLKTIPDSIRFYEKHAADRDRFEILSIYIDTTGTIDSLAKLDRGLAPIIEHAWGGKSIPFPILLDNTFETWCSFGIPGLGLVLLIDPEGHLIEGDLDTLEEKLKR